MYRCKQTGTVIETVRHDGGIAHGRDRKDFAQLGDAPHFSGARLHKVDRSRSHEPFEVHESRDIFSGGDRDAARSPQLSQTIIIFWWPDRLFQPFQVQLLEFFRSSSSLVQCPSTVHIEHYLSIRGLVAGGANSLEKFGTEEQKQKYLAPRAQGKKHGGWSLTEPGAGADAGGPRTVAVK